MNIVLRHFLDCTRNNQKAHLKHRGFVLLLQNYNICSFKDEWTCQLHLPRRYILYTLVCFFHYEFLLVSSTSFSVILLCPCVFYIPFVLVWGKTSTSWILKQNHNTVSGVVWELGNTGATGMLYNMLPRIAMPSATVLFCGYVFLWQVSSISVSQCPALCSSSGWLSYLLFWVFIKALNFASMAEQLCRSLQSVPGLYQMHISVFLWSLLPLLPSRDLNLSLFSLSRPNIQILILKSSSLSSLNPYKASNLY